jgi:hypothetical protein
MYYTPFESPGFAPSHHTIPKALASFAADISEYKDKRIVPEVSCCIWFINIIICYFKVSVKQHYLYYVCSINKKKENTIVLNAFHLNLFLEKRNRPFWIEIRVHHVIC